MISFNVSIVYSKGKVTFFILTTHCYCHIAICYFCNNQFLNILLLFRNINYGFDHYNMAINHLFTIR